MNRHITSVVIVLFLFKVVPLQHKEDAPNINLLLAARGRWKRLRLIMNPTFSSSKLKEVLIYFKLNSVLFIITCLFLIKMGPLIYTCTDRLVDKLKEVNLANQEINVTK